IQLHVGRVPGLRGGGAGLARDARAGARRRGVGARRRDGRAAGAGAGPPPGPGGRRRGADAAQGGDHPPGRDGPGQQGDRPAAVEAARVEAGRPLDSLTPMGDGVAWPSPDDTRPELDALAPPGVYDSVLVLWPQRRLDGGGAVPTGGWGLAIRATDWSNGATY